MLERGTIVAQQIQSEYGKISIREEVIAKIAGVAAMECYGLVGMARGMFRKN